MKQIKYEDLKPKQQENYNHHKLAAILADYGYNCIKLSDDWQGTDFLADHIDGKETLRVQLKGRVLIDKKYQGRNLYMAFPVDDHPDRLWYLVKHEELVELVGKHAPKWLEMDDWVVKGRVHTRKPSKQLLEALDRCRLNGEDKGLSAS